MLGRPYCGTWSCLSHLLSAVIPRWAQPCLRPWQRLPPLYMPKDKCTHCPCPAPLPHPDHTQGTQQPMSHLPTHPALSLQLSPHPHTPCNPVCLLQPRTCYACVRPGCGCGCCCAGACCRCRAPAPSGHGCHGVPPPAAPPPALAPSRPPAAAPRPAKGGTACRRLWRAPQARSAAWAAGSWTGPVPEEVGIGWVVLGGRRQGEQPQKVRVWVSAYLDCATAPAHARWLRVFSHCPWVPPPAPNPGAPSPPAG